MSTDKKSLEGPYGNANSGGVRSNADSKMPAVSRYADSSSLESNPTSPVQASTRQALNENSLEESSTADNSYTPPPSPDLGVHKPPRQSILLRFNGRAFLLTGITFAVILILGLAGLLLGSKHNAANLASQNGNQLANNYSVGNIPLAGVQANQQLLVGEADHLAINGQLRVSNSIILVPMARPGEPSAGQIYYDQNSNQPYYYNGQQFVSLSPASVSRVSSLQGLTGNVTLAAGSGISISGTTISNRGILGSGGIGQIALFTGAQTLSGSLLSQSGNTLMAGGNLSVAGDATISGNATVSGSVNAAAFNGVGTNLTNLDANNITGGILAVTYGGTGGATGADARADLQAAQSGANSDITSLLDLTAITPPGALTIGATGQNLTLQGATTELIRASGGFTSALGFAAPTANNVIVIPDASGTVCISTGNCAGSGGGITGPGTVNTIPLFSDTQEIGDSIITQDSGATTISIGGQLTATGQLSANGGIVTNGATIDTGTGIITGDGSGLINLNATNIATGTVADARLSANVTLQGNTFNGVSQLLQLTNTGVIPVLNGVNLTNLNATNLTSGTVADIRLSNNVALLNQNNQVFSGINIFQPTSGNDSVTFFRVQNAAGSNTLIDADTANGRIGVNTAVPAYPLDVVGQVNSSVGFSINGVPICTTSGCTAAAGSGNYIQNGTATQTANFNVQAATSGSVAGILEANAAGSGDILDLRNGSGVNVATVGSTGATLLQNSTNSTTAFVVQNATAGVVLDADTTNARVGIGTAAPAATLDVNGSSIFRGNIVLTNGYGLASAALASSNVTIGDVLINTGNTVATTTTPRDTRVIGVADRTALNGTVLNVIYGGTALVNVDAGAVALGDQLVASATVGKATVDNTATSGIIGTAVTTKSAGSAGSVYAYIRPVGGESTPNFRPITNSTTAFMVQNAAGSTTLFDADTTDGTIGIGQLGNSSYTLGVTGTINATSNIYVNGVAVCTVTSGCAGGGSGFYINNGTATQTGNFNVQAATSGSVAGILEANASGSGDILDLRNGSGVNVATVGSTGATLFENSTNSTTAFQIQNAGGSATVLSVDTTNQRVAIGTNASVSTLTVNGSSGANLIVLTPGAGGNTDAGYISVNQRALFGYDGNGNAIVEGALTRGVVLETNGSTKALTLSSGGAATFQNGTNSTTAFQIQNATGTSNTFDVDTSNSRIGIGTVAPTRTLDVRTSDIVVANFQSSATGAAVLDLQDSISSASSIIRTYNSGTGQWMFGLDGSDGGFKLEKNLSGAFTSSAVLTVASTGATTFKNNTNSTTAFQIQNAAGTDLFTADTTNSLLYANAFTNFSTGFNTYGDSAVIDTSTTAFQIQDAAGTSNLFVADTTNTRIGIGASPANSLLTVGTATTTASGGIYFGTDTTLFRSGTNTLRANDSFVVQPTTNETDAFDVISTTNNFALKADTVNLRVAIGTNSNPAYTLDVGGDVNTSTQYRIGGNVVLQDTGSNNIFTGYVAGNTSLTGSNNAGNGVLALNSLTSGTNNSAFGYSALRNTTTGGYDVGVGQYALQANTSGSYNTALGSAALYNATGSSNTGVGYDSLLSTSSGVGNVGVGFESGYTSVSANANTTGSYNTFLGYQAGPGTSTQLQNAAAIGAHSVVNQGDSLVLGCINGTNGCTTSTKVGIDNATPGYSLDVNGNINTNTAYLLNGTDINMAGALSNVAYLNQNQTFTGYNTFKSGTNSTTAFQIQDAAGTSNLLVADTTNTRIGIGAAPANGVLTVGTNTTTASGGLYFGTITDLYRSAGATLKTDGDFTTGGAVIAGSTNPVMLGGGTAEIKLRSDGNAHFSLLNTNGLFSIANTSTDGALGAAATNLFTLTNSGAALFQNSTNSTTAFQIQNAAGTSNLFVADTTNSKIGIGLAPSSSGATLQVSGSINTTSNYQIAGNVVLQNAGTNNIFTGYLAGNASVSGNDNTGNGVAALLSLTSGSNDTGLGYWALKSNTTGSNNTALGMDALQAVTTASNNTGVGYSALYNTTGGNNTSIGYDSLLSNSSGTNNVALGYAAGYTSTSANANTTGSYNTFLGYEAGPGVVSATSLQNATAIGTYSVVNQSNSLVLGCVSGINGCTTTTSVGVDNATPTGVLDIGGNTTTAAGGLYFGSDTDLYRAASGVLTTDTQLNVQGSLVAYNNFTNHGWASFANYTNSTTSFVVQNSSSVNQLVVDTTNQRVAVGPAAVPANAVLTVGTNTTAASGGIYFGTDTGLYRSGTSFLQTTGGLNVSGLFEVFNSALFKNSSNSTTAFQIQNAAGVSQIGIDTINSITNLNSTNTIIGATGTTVTDNAVLTVQAAASNGDIAQFKDQYGNVVVAINQGRIVYGQANGMTTFGNQAGHSSFAITDVNSAVNTLNLTNSATGSAPILGVQGSDTNIGLALTTKGTGGVTITPGSNSTTAFQVQNSGSVSALVVSTNNVSGTYNAANAILDVAADSGTNRSINAAGTINASGADYAEWIPWSSAKPTAGSIVTYQGSDYVVSSPTTAAFVGNDNIDETNAIMVTFAGQVPVKVTGTVNAGDILINNGDGTAKAIDPASAQLMDYLSKIGIAQASSSDTGVKLVAAAIGTTASSASAGLQAGSASFSDLNISGAATINNLVVTGSATINNLIVTGSTTVADITVNGHIITAGGQPTATAQTAAGVGATVSVNGDDTTGTITIKTGNDPLAGALAQINFSKSYGAAPHIVISPSDDAASAMRYFENNATTGGFTFNAHDAPTANTTYTYEYFIAQ